MKRIVVCILCMLVAASAWAEVNKAQLALFKKESAPIRAAIFDSLNETVPGRSGAESVKATYLEGYGAVFTLEASLEPTRSPFSSPKTPAEVRAVVTQRRAVLEDKLQGLLKKHAAAMESVGALESVTIVLYLFNSNPVDVPNLPSQIQFTVKKQDPARVTVQAF
jgi:hypothetical protein